MLKSELDSEMLKRRQIDASIVAKLSRLKALGGGESTTDSTEKMYYILGDCAGEMNVDTERDVILLSDLLDGLIVNDDGTDAGDGGKEDAGEENELAPASDNKSVDGRVDTTTTLPSVTHNEDSRPTDKPIVQQTQPKRKQYVFNKRYNCWLPKWVIAVNGSNYSKLKKEALSTRAFKSLFRGQQTRFPRKAKAIITASTIPAAGASDFGVQSVVFGTTKAIAEVMGIKISHEQLSKAMPSTDSLRNWEFDLAGGCLASVIDRIAKDALLVKQQTGMPLQISLITDHGNREGVDHLVKMI